MSKLEQDTFKIQAREINLLDLIETITKDLAFFASQKNIRIINKIPPDNYVFTDSDLLEKALKNIIHNAIMYSPQGETVYLALTEDSKQNQIQIQIINTGIQIKADELQQLFQPFYRIEKSRNRNTGGSGLGLYIVKQIFQSLSINYSVNNMENGIQFLVTFPER